MSGYGRYNSKSTFFMDVSQLLGVCIAFSQRALFVSIAFREYRVSVAGCSGASQSVPAGALVRSGLAAAAPSLGGLSTFDGPVDPGSHRDPPLAPCQPASPGRPIHS